MTINPFHNPSRRRRRLLLASSLALGLAGGSAAASTPASASTGIVFCFTLNHVEYCIELPHAIDIKDLVCPGCPELAVQDDYVTNPEIELTIAEELANGVGNLLVADVIGDRAAQRAGLAHLERAAALTSPGIAATDRQADAWTRVEQNVADGLQLLQQAAGARDPALASRLHDQALDHFDDAVDLLADGVAVG